MNIATTPEKDVEETAGVAHVDASAASATVAGERAVAVLAAKSTSVIVTMTVYGPSSS